MSITLLCLVAFLAGCRSVPAPAGSTSGRPSTAALPAAAPPPAPASSPSGSAHREAVRLVSLAALPTPHVVLKRAPAALSGPAMGTPGVRSLVDVARIYRIPLPFEAAVAWLHAHRPHGLVANGSSSSSSAHDVTTVGVGYDDDRTSTAWTTAQLDIGVASDGGSSSIWRVDGVVVWLDTRPAIDDAHGRRLSVTVASGCPADDKGVVGVAATAATPASALLPAQPPTGALVCRYGSSGSPFALLAHRRLTAAQARVLADDAARISLAHTDGAVTSCGADFGSVVVLGLSYPHDRSSGLWLRTSGCGSVANGRIVATQSAAFSRFAAAATAAARP